MTILKKLVVAGRKFVDKEGKEKTVWKTVGHLHQTNDGTRKYITIDPSVNFAAFTTKEGYDRIYVNLFEPEDASDDQSRPTVSGSVRKVLPVVDTLNLPQPAGNGSGFDDMIDDVPF